MRRLAISVLATVTFLVASIWFVWYFAYKLDPHPPQSAEIEGLSSDVSINWREGQINEIVAANHSDAAAGLGFMHGTQDTWAALLLRQTAIGKLGEWFGADAIEMDIATRMLGLDELARTAAASLSAPAKRQLDAYAAGMNAAIQDKEIRRDENLVLLRIANFDPWQPWHSIAVERLLAWLATTVDVDETVVSETAPVDLIRLLEASVKIKDWLALDGFGNSVAWTVRQNDETHLFSRVVYGASVLSYLREFDVAMPDNAGFSGVALVGTPFVFAGQSMQRSWTVLPHQVATVAPVASASTTTRRSRIQFADGSEQIVAYSRTSDGLFFPTDSTAGVLLSWPGLRYASDVETWTTITERIDDFSILDGTSIDVSRDGEVSVSGPPESIIRIPGGTFLSHSTWAQFPAKRLSEWLQSGDPINIPALKSDTFSPWAKDLLPRLLTLTSDSSSSSEYNESIQYLRNWDYSFNPSSIAGAIFDSWTTRIWLTTGIRPGIDPTIPVDSLEAERALRAAVDGLTQAFGPDESTWRWERVQFTTRSWPFWPMISKRSAAMGNSRFAPIRATGSGHPSSLNWGATSYIGRGLPPGRFESWTSTNDWRWHYSSDTNLGRLQRLKRTDAPVSAIINGVSPLPSTSTPSQTTNLRPRPDVR